MFDVPWSASGAERALISYAPPLWKFMTLSLNPRVELCISKLEQVMAILVRQQKEKSCQLKVFKPLYLRQFLRF